MIFHAQLNPGVVDDPEYQATSARLRKLAFEAYDCQDFVSYGEGDQEITISYWRGHEAVRRWKQAPEHESARELAGKHWYRWYRVQVVEISRQYESGSSPAR